MAASTASATPASVKSKAGSCLLHSTCEGAGFDRGSDSVVRAVDAGGALAVEAGADLLARAAEIARTGMVGTAAMVVSRRLAVLSGRPVVGLLDTFAPLWRRVPARFSQRLALVTLHDDGV